MALNSQSIEAKTNDWSIPEWIKVAVTFFASSAGAVFILSVLNTQKALLGLATEVIVAVSLGLVFLLILVTVAFWFFPNSTLTLFLYWVIRYFREQICIFALLGIVYLLAIHAAFFSLRGGIPLIDLIALFLMGAFVRPVGVDRSPLPWMKRFSTFLEKLINKINSLPTLPLSAIVALLPILVICSVIYFGLKSSLLEYRPYSFWNDETGYWLWIRSFGHVGFNSGYNAPNELIAPAAFNHYGEGSPFYIYIYGGIARLVGWFPSLPIFINFVILAVAVFLFTRLTKLEPMQIIFTGLITVVTWPILLYLPMTTHETLNQAIGFGLAILFFILLTRREQVSLLTRIAFVLLIYLAALIRLSWGLLLIPVIFYCLNGSVFRRVLFSVLFGSGLYISAILITNYLVPPTNNSILVNIKGSLLQGPQIFVKYIALQFFQMFKFKKPTPNMAVTFQSLIIMAWSAIHLARLIKSRLPIVSILQSQTVFDFYNMATLLTAGLLFYLQEGFYRTFTPSLLLVYLLQTIRKDYRPLLTLLAINILFFNSYMTFYAHMGDFEIIRSDFTNEFPERVQLQSEIEKQITFDPTTPNPWCNTLLIPLQYYGYRLTVIPPGIGISYIQDVDTLRTPIKSKYLLFDQETYEVFADRLHSRLLESSSIGDLYYNADSGCPLNP